MLHSTNIRMLQKHSKVATFEGSFESNTFVYALLRTLVCKFHMPPTCLRYPTTYLQCLHVQLLSVPCLPSLSQCYESLVYLPFLHGSVQY